MSQGANFNRKITMIFSIATILFTVRIVPPPKGQQLTVYPNPFKSSKHTVIFFKGLGKQTTIRIYNIFGERVREITNQDNEVEWDVRNDFGRKVASGIYIYVITNKEGKKTGKLAIIK